MKTGKADDLLDWLKPGSRVYVQGGSGECSAFIDLLKANPGAVSWGAGSAGSSARLPQR